MTAPLHKTSHCGGFGARFNRFAVSLFVWSGGIVYWLSLASFAQAGEQDEAAIRFFENKVRPLLLAKCVECHDAEEPESGLQLSTAAGLFRGGESGRVVVAGKPNQSRLIQAVRGTEDLQMPPETKLSPAEIAIFEKWVKTGAVWPGYKGAHPKGASHTHVPFTDREKSHWAFQPVQEHPVPKVQNSQWPTSPIDAFVLSKLEEQGLQPAPGADKKTLLRRVTFDLTGLPPTLGEIDDFINDNSPTAYARVVERLLASPHYGERWGRHWLDVARFAESAAHDGNNAYLHAWRYRDYVIAAFNNDKPYNQFVIEQLAGDLLPKTDDKAVHLERMIATGFLQIGPKPVVMRDKKQMLLDIADEQATTTGVAFMAMTIGCARCHDHKFDPIRITDYYSLAGIFMSTLVMADFEPDSKWIEPAVTGPDGQQVKVMAVLDQEKPANIRVHLRGNYRTLGDEVPRRYLQIIAGEKHAPIETSGSGRLELARWIAGDNHPLTARVMVNRIWQQHFGRGLVPSSNDFGFRGDQPSHPRLLDWLAKQFVASGWSIKQMHRLMLLSSTYRQAHIEDDASAASDPDNRLLWRMPRRRLSAEEIRDSLLAISGRLDSKMAGTLFTSGYNFNAPKRELAVVDVGKVDDYSPYKEPRRSVYLPMIRNQMFPMLLLFDMANVHESVAVRSQTTVAPQALFLMNSPFIREQASGLTNRIMVTTADSDDERIRTAHLLVFGRPPHQNEVQAATVYLQRYVEISNSGDSKTQQTARTARLQAWQSYCQALLCSNEYIYVE